MYRKPPTTRFARLMAVAVALAASQLVLSTAQAADSDVTTFRYYSTVSSLLSQLGESKGVRKMGVCKDFKEVLSTAKARRAAKGAGKLPKKSSVYGLISRQIDIYAKVGGGLSALSTKDVDPKLVKAVEKINDGVTDGLNQLCELLPKKAGGARLKNYKKTVTEYKKLSKTLDKFEGATEKQLAALTASLQKSIKLDELLERAEKDRELAVELFAPAEEDQEKLPF